MTLEQRIAKLKAALAEEYCEGGQECEIRHNAYLAGTEALAEVYRLEGRIAALKEVLSWVEVLGRAEKKTFETTKNYIIQLEALLKQMEKV